MKKMLIKMILFRNIFQNRHSFNYDSIRKKSSFMSKIHFHNITLLNCFSFGYYPIVNYNILQQCMFFRILYFGVIDLRFWYFANSKTTIFLCCVYMQSELYFLSYYHTIASFRTLLRDTWFDSFSIELCIFFCYRLVLDRAGMHTTDWRK